MIDWNRPVAEIIGSPPAKYEQDGQQFKADGSKIDDLTVATVRAHLKEGLSHTDIAEKYGVTRQRVTYIARQPS